MRLFVFGLGYSPLHFIQQYGTRFSTIAGTVRTDDKKRSLQTTALEPLLFDGTAADPLIEARIAEADQIVVSIPPDSLGDPVLRVFGEQIASCPARRIVYLSTVGVYDDHAGAWIDETAPIISNKTRRGRRVDAEAAWRAVAPGRVSILRLAGIYGPGRNALLNMKSGKARRIIKAGQVFNRIHVEDIAQATAAAFRHPDVGIWNICDDEPGPPQDVVTFAAGLMGMTPPEAQDFDSADMTEMARSFYATSNRISNARMTQQLGVQLAFPDYRQGLTALWRAGEGRL